MERSISEYFYHPSGEEGHRCGYCGSADTSISHGMWTHHLTCEDYRDLIDRGWRRCGKYCYKPIMDRTCCPMYAIRCEATQFRLSKSQKKVLKRMNEYLLRGKQRGTSEAVAGEENKGKVSGEGVKGKHSSCAEKDRDVGLGACGGQSTKVVRPGLGPDGSKPPCRKAKEVRREHWQQKQLKNQEQGAMEVGGKATSEPVEPSQSFLEVGPDGKKPLETFLPLPASDRPPTHHLEIKLIQSSPPSREFKSTFKESYAVYRKYQMAVHDDKEEDCTEKQYRRFLCDSSLIPREGPQGWSCGYGSYHQHYYIDGKLIMVGVVDILPDCLSSVYVYYDPDYAFLSPGVYSALREIELTRKLFLHCPTFTRYCMGYYVHSCQKMRYKGQYYPSLLLCPESYKYIPVELCRPKLDASRYARLNDAETEPEVVDLWLSNTLVLFQRMAMPYHVLKSILGGKHEAKVREYATLVGPVVTSRMLLFIQ